MVCFYREGDIKISVSHIRYYGGWADKISGGAYIPVLNSNQISCHTRREPVGVVVAVSQPPHTSSNSSSSSSNSSSNSNSSSSSLLLYAGGKGFVAAAMILLVVAAFFCCCCCCCCDTTPDSSLNPIVLGLAAIVPWNFPLVLSVLKAAPALACGCTVVIKSSEKTPLTVLAFCKLMQKAGFPPGVLNVVNGWGDTVGATLIQHPLVNKVSFTGSSAVGKKVAQECAATMKRVTLELGGKSPLVILKDADIKKACEATWQGLFFNSGQCCVACSRILVQAEVGYWVLPTIFTDVTDEMKVSKEEIFGPVVCVSKFDTIEEAVKRANDTPYGLGAGVFTSSIPLANYFVSRLHAGTVWVNTYLQGDTGIPFGGFKGSGYGREGGEEGLLPFLEVKTVVTSIEL
ncbi:hypothetical protein Emed_004885 [Eimeria media]